MREKLWFTNKQSVQGKFMFEGMRLSRETDRVREKKLQGGEREVVRMVR